MARRRSAGLVGLLAVLAACQERGAEGAPDSTDAQRLLCPNCVPSAGGDTTDFGGGLRVPCDGEETDEQEVDLTTARERGFDPDATSDAAVGTYEAPVRWIDEGSETTLYVEIAALDKARLVSWSLFDEPPEISYRCHDDDYVVPHVEVSLRTDDGKVQGRFEAELGPNRWGDPNPALRGDRRILWLRGDASGFTGSLTIDVDPDRAARYGVTLPEDAEVPLDMPMEDGSPPAQLSVTLGLVYTDAAVPARAELSLVLAYPDEDGWQDIAGQGAEPADGCGLFPGALGDADGDGVPGPDLLRPDCEAVASIEAGGPDPGDEPEDS